MREFSEVRKNISVLLRSLFLNPALGPRWAENNGDGLVLRNPYVGVVGVESIRCMCVECCLLRSPMFHPSYVTPNTSSTAAQLQSPSVSLRLPRGGPMPIPVHDGTQWGSWALPLNGLLDDFRGKLCLSLLDT